jgi:hypoxanthine-DNA glycosylase
LNVAAQGFPPIADSRARLLILGSLPGQASLAAAQYYAQPRNAFWRILAELLGVGTDLDYAARTAALRRAGIALWDVCAAAERRGSLDASIRRDSVVVNDFAAFLPEHPRIVLLAFNGATAAELYRRRVLPALPPAAAALPTLRLPSTSPAHAGLPYVAKRAAWGMALRQAGVCTTAPTVVASPLRPATGPRAASARRPRRRSGSGRR